MGTNNKTKSYQAQAKVTVLTSIEIRAGNIEDAIVKAKELKQEEFVEILGEHLDSNFELTGVYTSDGL